MSSASHGRLLRGVRRSVGRARKKPGGEAWPRNLTAAVEKLEREAPAVQAIVALALELAGTDKLLPPEPEPLAGDASPILPPQQAAIPPRAAPPRPQPPRWTKDIRPGPHDVLTWEEAMQVPWFDPFAETER